MNGRMQIASVMADEASPEPNRHPSSAKLGKHNVELDPDLIKLRRARPKVGILTAAGVVFLAVFFLMKLNPDRRFAGNGDETTSVTVADLIKGHVDEDSYVSVPAEPLMSTLHNLLGQSNVVLEQI